MTEKIGIRFYNNENEFAEATRVYNSRALHYKIDLVVEIVLLIGAISLWAYFGFSWAWVFAIVASVIGFLLTYLANYVIPIIRFRREPKFTDEYFLEFGEDGIEFKTEHVSSKLDWSYYNKVWETDKFFLLFYGKALFSTLPKRAFQDDEAQNQFRKLVGRKINTEIVKV